MKTGVILNNIGSPESVDPKDVRAYLSEFLYDPYVIQIPNPMRYLLVKGLIAPLRGGASALKYKKIWGKKKSPLIEITDELSEKVQKILGEKFLVLPGMRYSKPSIRDALQKMMEFGVEKIIFFPMYPQFATASSQSSSQKFKDELNELSFRGEALELQPFFGEAHFIKLLANKLKSYAADRDNYFIFSYHSLPLAQLKKLDRGCEGGPACCLRPEALRVCYRAQCLYTSKKIAEHLELSEDRYTNAFQSRLGLNKWIGPNLPLVLEDLVKNKKKIIVSAPSFVTDCLETLEEIDMENRQIVERSEGKFTYVPCLNADDEWAKWIAQHSVNALQQDESLIFQRVQF